MLDHLAGQRAARPSAVAIDDGIRTVTFAVLYDRACAIGAAVRVAGWPAGAVGVLLGNDATYIEAMFGCLAAGRACMLLAPNQPAAFLRQVIGSAGLAGVISDAGHATRLPQGLPWLDAAAVKAAPAAPPVMLDVGAPAFIVATSGTTGAPKAVVSDQGSMLRNFVSRIRLLRVGPEDRVAATAPPATSGALAHRLYGLLMGARLQIIDIPSAGLGGTLARCTAGRTTILHATPALLTSLARLPPAREAFAALRLVMLGGDAMLQVDLAALRRMLPEGCRVQYALSLSEAARVAAWFVPPDDDHDPARVAAGYLVDGVEIQILDEHGTPVPPGTPGELVVRSETAALGHWIGGQVVPDQFLSDPGHPGRRIFHTGDIVRLCSDGVLVVLGRRDRMVKISGQLIQPATIEMAMRALPWVADAAVIAVRTPGMTRLAGFVVARRAALPGDDDAALLSALRQALLTSLPAAMVPPLLRRIPEIPLTAAGKRNEAALLASLGPP